MRKKRNFYCISGRFRVRTQSANQHILCTNKFIAVLTTNNYSVGLEWMKINCKCNKFQMWYSVMPQSFNLTSITYHIPTFQRSNSNRGDMEHSRKYLKLSTLPNEGFHCTSNGCGCSSYLVILSSSMLMLVVCLASFKKKF